MNKNRKIPSIIAILTLVIGLVAGMALIQNQQSVNTSASAEEAPKNVAISNVHGDTFTVTWTTDIPTLGFITWGEGDFTSTPSQSIGSEAKEVHMVKVRDLNPSTSYSFRINSGNNSYQDGNNLWKVETGPDLGTPKTTKVIYGTVESKDGQPVAHAVVSVSGDNIAPISALTSSNGSWVIPINLARSPNLGTYASVDDDRLNITVLADSQRKATALINANIEGTVPAIVIGQAHDFTNLTTISKKESPNEDLKTKVQGISSSSAVTLESLDHGEVIFTNVPEFFGEGPAGKEINITVHSDPVSGTAVVENDGEWKWSPIKTLENGLHNITIEWEDAQGIIHTLTRSFIVQAQEGQPSFESTPSGTTSPTPTATPRATATPTATPKATATPKPTIKATPTTTPVSTLPDAGTIAPSVLLGAIGFVTLSLGAVLALKK